MDNVINLLKETMLESTDEQLKAEIEKGILLIEEGLEMEAAIQNMIAEGNSKADASKDLRGGPSHGFLFDDIIGSDIPSFDDICSNPSKPRNNKDIPDDEIPF